eukprot:m.151184 g.151184  ORF g.151184 m.151184 type:complete len:123 (+) comp9755_c0_seq5:859-1227(+)
MASSSLFVRFPPVFPGPPPVADAGKQAIQVHDDAGTLAPAIHTIDWQSVFAYYFELERLRKPFPLHGLDMRVIEPTDPRVALRGQLGLFVQDGWMIPAYTVLGPYTSLVSFDAEYNEQVCAI